MSRLPLPLLLLAALWLPAPARAACNEIPSLPIVISSPGVYCLTGMHDIYDTSANGLTIDGDYITLDCDGGTIRYRGAVVPDNTISAIYVTDRRHVTIRNCTVMGEFGIGIHVDQDSSSQQNVTRGMKLEDNVVSGSLWYGILAHGTSLELQRNRVIDVGGRPNSFAMGIRVGSSPVAGQQRLVRLRDNLVSGTHSAPGNYAAYGIYSENGVASAIVDNEVVGTAGAFTWGIRLGGSRNRVTGNAVTGSGLANDVGIQSNSSTDACYDNHLRATTPTVTCNAALGNY